MISQKLLYTIKANYYFPRHSKWIFALLILGFSLLYNYQEILFKPAQSRHLWRQCDCLSFTLNFTQTNNPIYEPAIHNLGEDGTGRTASEFPLFYYLIGKLWKFTGQHEFLYRMGVLSLFFLSLFALFRLFETVLKDSFLALFGALILFTSPTLVYYANNYLMDIPALSFAIFGFYFFYQFYLRSNNKLLYLSMFCYGISGLLKISSLLSYFAILGVFLFEVIGNILQNRERIFKNPAKQFIPLVAVLIIQLIWYLYVRNYNEKYTGGNFLVGILPIWEMDADQIKNALTAIINHIKWDYFRRGTQAFFVIVLFLLFIFHKKNKRLLNQLVLFLFIGTLLFILLFFNALEHHDYYVINLFIIFPVLLMGFFHLLKNNAKRIYTSPLFRLIIIGFLIYNLDFSTRRINGRYDPDGWINEPYTSHFQHYEKLNPYLQSIGIGKDEKVICLSDYSINISLYLMNRKGWTDYNIGMDSSRLAEKIRQGASFLIIHNDQGLDNPALKSFFSDYIGEYEELKIFKVKERNSKGIAE